MEETIGKRIAARRKEKGYTQEEIAERLGITAQAVSKWENDTSCPDISLLPALAEMLGTTVDALLSGKTSDTLRVLPPEERRSIDEMTLRILVDTAEDNDRVRVSVPMALVRVAIEMGMQLPQITSKEALKGIDINSVFRMVENGVIGKLMEVETGDGTTVTILVE
ncbi:MAG: helix-turn-helix transcriptional regulator [Oscillospiraceae bacterium]|nr:helix-turn-helix domain-containing protein [Oscillospiraceae bacterium]MDY3066130.1 helix-turn-helix transcriptional regulator [Oscillospiraceae bacterium]